MKRYGVRELRQNTTAILRDVAAGETIVITSNGHPVAHIIAPTTTPWSALIAAGEVTPARTNPAAILTRTAHTTPTTNSLATMRRGEQ